MGYWYKLIPLLLLLIFLLFVLRRSSWEGFEGEANREELKRDVEICEDCIEGYVKAEKEIEREESKPLVFKRDGVYYVYIFKDSPLHRRFGYYGKRSYGSDRARARALFEENFPGMEVPPILRYDGDPDRSALNCPFILRDGNPCASNACSYVDWSNPDIDQQKLTDECKWSIDNYCYQNATKDPSCACWDTSGEYYSTDYCRAFRKRFETAGGSRCKIDLFEIEEHPDMKNYIRKDRVPCWGCDLDAPQPQGPIARSYENS